MQLRIILHRDRTDTRPQIVNYSDQLDPNRLPIEDMEDFVDEVGDDHIRSIWEAIKVSWGIYVA